MALPNKEEWSEWPFELRVACNRVNGVYGESKYGFNPNIINATEDVWDQGGVLSYLSSAETMDIVSGDPADKGTPTAGTGARTITIYGVGNNYNVLQETVIMNGTTPVTTTSAFLRINRMHVETSGTNQTNVGNITATASTAGTVQASIGAGIGSTTKSQYTVPAGYFGFISAWSVGTLNNDQVQADLMTRSFEGSWVVRNRINFVESAFQQNFTTFLRVSPQSDIRVQAIRVAGSGNVTVSTTYEFDLVKEELVVGGNPVAPI